MVHALDAGNRTEVAEIIDSVAVALHNMTDAEVRAMFFFTTWWSADAFSTNPGEVARFYDLTPACLQEYRAAQQAILAVCANADALYQGGDA